MTTPSAIPRRTLLAGVLAAPMLATAAYQVRSAEPAAMPRTSPTAPAHWSYRGDTGPARWGEIGYPTCTTGRRQSPISLTGAVRTHLRNPDLSLRPGAARVHDTGHAILFTPTENGGRHLLVHGRRYELLQMHHHSPGEHQVRGMLYPAEAHMVFQDPETHALAVVGILLRGGGRTHSWWKTYVDACATVAPHGSTPAEDESETEQVPSGATVRLPFDKLLPARRGSWRYSGSLTTPPCTEGISWTVLDTPVVLSDAQIATLSALHNGNNRPVQPRHDRVLLRDPR